jgi:hypothetical protein
MATGDDSLSPPGRHGRGEKMNQRAVVSMDERAKGIKRIRRLPHVALGAFWESIVIDEDMKRRLLAGG